jgi:hypothetical protein
MNRTLFSLIALAALALPVAAQDDPPSRVARLNLASGSVSFRPGSVEEWAPAALNYPLTSGDHLWVDRDSRTEIHIGSAAVRTAAETALEFLSLDDRTVQLSLTQGSLNIRLRELQDDESFEIDTPNTAVVLLRAGDYRIDADGDAGVTTVTVRDGDAQVSAGSAAFTLHPRESARLIGMDQVSQEMVPVPRPDEFDSWTLARDRHEDQMVQSARYVPRDMIGYEDLDENGVWSEVPDYGWVWRPRVVTADWAPYRFGHWAWVEPWGWTWIDDAPWGFAPFHYGRWAMIAGAWVWVPGRMIVGVRPVYAPALVAFVGGDGFGAGVSAWFPLGPRESYIPAYRVSEVYVRQVNIMHATVVSRIGAANVRYVNQGVPGAVTAVSRETFVGARPVGGATVGIDVRAAAQGRVFGTAAPLPPERSSVIGHSGRPAAAPPARFVERRVVMRNAPASPAPSMAPRSEGRQFGNPSRPVVTQPPANPRPRFEERVPDRPAPRPERPMPAPAVREERPAVRPERPAAREERRDERKGPARRQEKKEERKQ